MSIPPLKPQTVDVMRARFERALEVVFQYGPEGNKIPPYLPGLDNFFDFSDGMRICVTRDAYGGRLERHVSASVLTDTELWNYYKSLDGFGMVSQALFKLLVEDRYRSISGDDLPFKFAGVSASKGVPHWRRAE